MVEFKEASQATAVLSLDVAPNGRDVSLTLLFETDTAVRLPMNSEIAMRIWAVLEQARKDHGWSEPTMPVETSKLQ